MYRLALMDGSGDRVMLMEKEEKEQRDFIVKKKEFACVDSGICRQSIYQNSTKKLRSTESEVWVLILCNQ